MTQPTEPLIIWAEDNVNLPVTQQPNKKKPQESLRKTGWDKGQKPSCEEFNYILNNLAQYINYYGVDKTAEILNKTVSAGGGLTGGGVLGSNPSLSLGTPSNVGAGSVNSVSGQTHTHSLVLTSANISILTGTIADQGTIPLPSGYSESQCVWTVSPNNVYMIENNAPFSYRLTCSTSGRLVRVYGSTDDGTGVNPGTANYIIIGVK